VTTLNVLNDEHTFVRKKQTKITTLFNYFNYYL